MRYRPGHFVAQLIVTGLVAFAWCLVSEPTVAETPTTSSTTQPVRGKKRELAPFKKPPVSGAEPGAISGGSRGPEDPPSPVPYAPAKEVGLTSTDQPVIMFFMPESTSGAAIVSIFDTGKSKPTLIDIQFPMGFKAGVQRIDLAKEKASLKPGAIYQWNVTIVAKEGSGASDGFAAGHIKFDPSKKAVRDQVQSLPPDERAVAFANEGLWYDALAAMMDALEQNPGDESLTDQLSLWLRSEKIEPTTPGEKK